MATKQLKNFVQHQLTIAALVGDLVLTWDSVAGWPTVGDFIIRLDNPALTITELVLCTAVNVGANQTTVVRAQEGTGASAFGINSTGGNALTAQMLTDAFVRLDTALSQALTGPLVIPPTLGGAAAPTGYGSMPVKLAETLLAAPAASISWTSIPATFRHLEADLYARGDTAAVNTRVNARINNDSAANYDAQENRWDGGTSFLAESLGVTSFQVAFIPAATATANYYGSATLFCKHYAGTTGNKQINSVGNWAESNIANASCRSFAYNGKWRTAGTAINRLDLIPAAGNLVAGSLGTLWGHP